MEQTYEYAWIIPFIPLPIPMLIGARLILFPTATKSFCRMWAFQSVLLLSIVMVFSIYLSIQQINSSSFYQYVWSWIINNDFSLDFGYLIDPLTSIMSILITTVGIMVLIYSDYYMAHDQGYLRLFACMSFFSTSMLGLVTSSNLIQIYIFGELVGLCSLEMGAFGENQRELQFPFPKLLKNKNHLFFFFFISSPWEGYSLDVCQGFRQKGNKILI